MVCGRGVASKVYFIQEFDALAKKKQRKNLEHFAGAAVSVLAKLG
jgi:hypothetical protein